MESLTKSRPIAFYLVLTLLGVSAFLWYLYKPEKTYADIAQIAGQNKGEHSETPNSLPNLAYTGNVTNGNTIIITVIEFRSGVSNPVINTPTKAAGTATISALTRDATYTNNSGSNRFQIDVYRASVTATGSLTIGFTGTFDAAIGVINEYSGMDASPLDGVAVTNTNTGTTESTGTMTTSTCGVVIMSSTEVSTADFLYSSRTDLGGGSAPTDVYNNVTASTQFTGEVQHKITTAAGSPNLAISTGNSWFWVAVGVAYKAASCPTPSTSIHVKIRGGGSGTSVPNIKIRGGGGTPNDPFSTTFPATENPISQGGIWKNGQADGLDWTNVRTTTNFAFGTESGGGGFDDSTALLNNVSWGPDQTAQGTVVVTRASSDSGTAEEVELRLRSTLTAHSSTGYEVLCSVNSTVRYIQIVRWNGAFGDFTLLKDGTSGCSNGDVLKATAIGSTIAGYINGVLVISITDSTYTTGTPGMGFYLNKGDAGAFASDYGFSDFSTHDSNNFINVKFY
jgi:hypothetical protein